MQYSTSLTCKAAASCWQPNRRNEVDGASRAASAYGVACGNCEAPVPHFVGPRALACLQCQFWSVYKMRCYAASDKSSMASNTVLNTVLAEHSDVRMM